MSRLSSVRLLSGLLLGLLCVACKSEVTESSDSQFFAAEKNRELQVASNSHDAALREVKKRQLSSQTPATSLWEGFRRTFPYHTQVLALSEESIDGSRTLIISEPPPSVSLDDLLLTAQKVLRSHEINRHGIGFDGWASDLVLAIGGSDSDLAATLSQLTRLLYRSSYKAYIIPLPARSSSHKPFDLDLRVTAAELQDWISDTRTRFMPVEGGDNVTFSAIADRTDSEVLQAEGKSLIAWWLPREVSVQDCAVQAREFAIDSDLIIGSISNSKGLLVLARERMVPVDMLPPLRFETISLLASVQDGPQGQLEQSYERMYRFAGRFDREHDWAPILLSPSLIDTEYGSLLNITDQLLKGWSNNGQTSYVNFSYPRPEGWPFPKPLIEEIDSSGRESDGQEFGVVYNWNTKGAGYRVDGADEVVFALNRTGSLPVTYIPDGMKGKPSDAILQLEDKAYEFFSGRNDPNLIRVVQYASLYQMFSSFTQLDLTKVKERAPREFPALDGLLDDLTKDVKNKSDDDLQTLSYQLVERLGLREDHQKELLAGLTSLREGRESSDFFYGMALSGLAGMHEIHQKYATLAAKSKAWIHTPVVVISSNLNRPGVIAIGGHNLAAQIEHFKPLNEIPRGTIRINEEGELLVNPVDMPRASRLVRTAGRFEGESAENLALRLTRELEQVPQLPIRLAKDALHITEDFSRPTFGLAEVTHQAEIGPTKLIGWGRRLDGKPADISQSHFANLVLARRNDGVFSIHHTTSSSPLEAYTIEDATDAIVHLLRRSRGEGPLYLEMRGFEPHEATAFTRSVQVRSSETKIPREVSALVRDGTLSDETLLDLSKRNYNFDEVKISATEITETPEGLQRSIQVEIPSRMAGEATAKSMVELGFVKGTPRTIVERITVLVKEAIGRVIKALGSSIDSVRFNLMLNAEIKKIRVETGIDFNIIRHKFEEQRHDLYFSDRGLGRGLDDQGRGADLAA